MKGSVIFLELLKIMSGFLNFFIPNKLKQDIEVVSYRNSSFKVSSNSMIFLDSKLGEISIILPANPESGDTIILMDYNNTWNLNNINVIPNNKKILGKNENLVLNINNIIVILYYYGDDSKFQWGCVPLNFSFE